MDNVILEESIDKKVLYIPNWKRIVTVFLLLCGIIAMYLYRFCSTSCSNLKGTVFGIPLELIGVIYAFTIILLVSIPQKITTYTIIQALLSFIIGGEFYLMGYQVLHNTYCEYCIAYGISAILAFIVNFQTKKIMFYLLFAILGFIGLSIFLEISTFSYT